MTTLTLDEFGDGTIPPSLDGAPAGATDAAKALAEEIATHLVAAGAITWLRRHGTTVDAHARGHRYVILVAELPTP